MSLLNGETPPSAAPKVETDIGINRETPPVAAPKVGTGSGAGIINGGTQSAALWWVGD
jgi:hypothetical protein